MKGEYAGIPYPALLPVPRVYFMQRSDGCIKIGFSVRPRRRKWAVDREAGELTTLLGAVPGDLKEEQRIHALFASDRIGPAGEWFHPSPALVRFIEANVQHVPYWYEGHPHYDCIAPEPKQTPSPWRTLGKVLST